MTRKTLVMDGTGAMYDRTAPRTVEFDETEDIGPAVVERLDGEPIETDENGVPILEVIEDKTEDKTETEDEDDTPAEEFDPSEHTVAEVLEYIDAATPDERERVLIAETNGKARATLADLQEKE